MSRTRIGMTDVVVGSLLLAAAVGMASAAIVGQRESNIRVTCAQNLKQIGQAVMLYSNENRNAYPRTPVAMGRPPVWGTPYADDGADAKPSARADPFFDDSKDAPAAAPSRRPKPNDVTAPLWLLLRTQDLLPNVFICPSTRLKPIVFDSAKSDGVLGYTNFPGKRGVAEHLSYSYQNPYPTADAIGKGFKLNNSISAEFAFMADMNPGSVGLLTLAPTATPAEIAAAKGNSLNHRGEGQNVLFGDGHVEFETSPFVGVGRDNIYVANDPPARPISGMERKSPAFAASPADANDSILLPTAADVGQDLALPPVTPRTDAAEPAKRILGDFTQPISPRPIVGAPAAPAPRIKGRLRPPQGPMTPGGTLTMRIDEQTIRLTGVGDPATFTYAVVGTRGKAIVVDLRDAKNADVGQADFTFVGPQLYIDADGDATDALVGDAGAGPGWTRASK